MWGCNPAATVTIARGSGGRLRLGTSRQRKTLPRPNRFDLIGGAGKSLLLGCGGFALTQV
jgi:hypothetical protein